MCNGFGSAANRTSVLADVGNHYQMCNDLGYQVGGAAQDKRSGGIA
jgi:hypothetical protein